MTTMNIGKSLAPLALAATAAATPAAAQSLLTDHTDITFQFNPATATWSAELRHGGTFDNPDTASPLDLAALPAEDQPFSQGDRYVQPTAASFDFTGVPDGDPLWILPQTDRGYTWPGLRNDQTPGTFQAYNPGDPRVTATPQHWVSIRLVDVTYIGQSASAEFSAWQFQGAPIVWMATSDGITPDDRYYLLENAHSHLNWGFSALGIYRVGLEAEAILDATGQTVTSATHTVTFAIGTLATWQASHYSGPDLEDPATSGLSSDSDRDGLPLVLEYAFNLTPTIADSRTLTPGTGTAGLPTARIHSSGGMDYLEIEFIRRKTTTNPQITYTPEFNDTPDAAGWSASGTTQTTSIDPTWERVIVTDSQPINTNDSRFARVRVTIQPKGSY